MKTNNVSLHHTTLHSYFRLFPHTVSINSLPYLLYIKKKYQKLKYCTVISILFGEYPEEGKVREAKS